MIRSRLKKMNIQTHTKKIRDFERKVNKSTN